MKRFLYCLPFALGVLTVVHATDGFGLAQNQPRNHEPYA